MNEVQRKLILKYQFYYFHPLTFSTQMSLNRFYTFILEHTDIVFITFIMKDSFINYISYHQSNGFSNMTFAQVIKDIRIMISYLKNFKMWDIKVDLSLLNYNLW